MVFDRQIVDHPAGAALGLVLAAPRHGRLGAARSGAGRDADRRRVGKLRSLLRQQARAGAEARHQRALRLRLRSCCMRCVMVAQVFYRRRRRRSAQAPHRSAAAGAGCGRSLRDDDLGHLRRRRRGRILAQCDSLAAVGPRGRSTAQRPRCNWRQRQPACDTRDRLQRGFGARATSACSSVLPRSRDRSATHGHAARAPSRSDHSPSRRAPDRSARPADGHGRPADSPAGPGAPSPAPPATARGAHRRPQARPARSTSRHAWSTAFDTGIRQALLGGRRPRAAAPRCPRPAAPSPSRSAFSSAMSSGRAALASAACRARGRFRWRDPRAAGRSSASALGTAASRAAAWSVASWASALARRLEGLVRRRSASAFAACARPPAGAGRARPRRRATSSPARVRGPPAAPPARPAAFWSAACCIALAIFASAALGAQTHQPIGLAERFQRPLRRAQVVMQLRDLVARLAQALARRLFARIRRRQVPAHPFRLDAVRLARLLQLGLQRLDASGRASVSKSCRSLCSRSSVASAVSSVSFSWLVRLVCVRSLLAQRDVARSPRRGARARARRWRRYRAPSSCPSDVRRHRVRGFRRARVRPDAALRIRLQGGLINKPLQLDLLMLRTGCGRALDQQPPGGIPPSASPVQTSAARRWREEIAACASAWRTVSNSRPAGARQQGPGWRQVDEPRSLDARQGRRRPARPAG